MALIPSSRYPAQTDTGDAAYPRGKARNAGSFQDGTGTPLEASWLNDLWGFQQALLGAAEITPSGTPDAVGASQYLDALVSLASLKVGVYGVSGFGVPYAGSFSLSEQFQRGGFTLASNVVKMPRPGRYLVLLVGQFHSPSTANPKRLTLGFSASGGAGSFATNTSTTRHSASTSEDITMSLLRVGNVTGDPEMDDEEDLKVESQTDAGGLSSGGATLVILAL